MAPKIRSFPAISDPRADMLILGSMPGAASLKAGQYYAHTRNCFWNIMEELLGVARNADYALRLEALKENRIALWDVLEHCEREGSLDSAIRAAEVNDFEAFFAAHPQITRVFFNGSKAADVFQRRVLKDAKTNLKADLERADIEFIALPSTSPANASISFEKKLKAWRAVLRG
jgi:hypoxanthine-DNA glycosylase